jgi:hypothetical protein
MGTWQGGATSPNLASSHAGGIGKYLIRGTATFKAVEDPLPHLVRSHPVGGDRGVRLILLSCCVFLQSSCWLKAIFSWGLALLRPDRCTVPHRTSTRLNRSRIDVGPTETESECSVRVESKYYVVESMYILYCTPDCRSAAGITLPRR